MSADRDRLSVAAAYYAFIVIGIAAGVGGVLLPAQMADYGVDRTKIGITFFLFSVGFMAAASAVGPLIQRLGMRAALALGTVAIAASSLYTGTRPAFFGLVAAQAVQGFGFGVVESALNTHLTRLPHAARRLNRLHAFFGVGALVGPPLATSMLRSGPWTRVSLVIGVLLLPLIAAFLRFFQDAQGPAEESGGSETSRGGGLFASTVRERAVLLAALFLAVYVGLEISVGNWGFSFLTESRGFGHLAAGYAVSGFWFGLTAGRFAISPAAARIGLDEIGMIFACLAGIVVATGLIGLLSAPALSGAGFVLLGCFFGPIFPTTMAVTPRLTEARRVPTAIGVINAASTLGGSGLPWLAGTVTQGAGMGALVPYCLVLGLALAAVWWRLARHVPAEQGGTRSATATPGAAAEAAAR